MSVYYGTSSIETDSRAAPRSSTLLFYNIIRQMEASRGTKEIECIEEEEKESAEKAHGAVNPTRFAMELFYAVSLSPFQHLNT